MIQKSKFDNKVQVLKYRVIREIIRKKYAGDDMASCYIDIPKKLIPGPQPSMRCCIYKERAILQERIKLALGGDSENPNVVEVIDIACDECPVSGIYITPACRGCLVHKCQESCPKDAITIINNKPIIDKSKCVECGRCVKACPYNAIIEQHRPCVASCKVKAITVGDDKKVSIDNSKCISCGACTVQCPFGAVSDKSYITDCVDLILDSKSNKNYKVYAIIAPAFAAQFREGTAGQLISGLKELGFYDVVEAALGADITLYKEAKELKENGMLTTSCCPSYVMFVEKFFPTLAKYISSSSSPMVETAKLIKKADPTAKCVFIGPCTSKKMEYKLPKTGGAIDCVISFEECQAYLAALDVDISQLEESEINSASFYGRIFAKSGGITQGLGVVAKEMGIDDVRPISMNGIAECNINLIKWKLGKASENFFEGMACEGGCLNGALCPLHGQSNIVAVDKFSHQATEKSIEASVEKYKKGVLNLHEENK